MPLIEKFHEVSLVYAQVKFHQNQLEYMSRVLGGEEGSEWAAGLPREEIIEVQCYPLESLLLAANITTVHYLSLDVEGAELDILRAFPWQDFEIQVSSGISALIKRNPNIK